MKVNLTNKFDFKVYLLHAEFCGIGMWFKVTYFN